VEGRLSSEGLGRTLATSDLHSGGETTRLLLLSIEWQLTLRASTTCTVNQLGVCEVQALATRTAEAGDTSAQQEEPNNPNEDWWRKGNERVVHACENFESNRRKDGRGKSEHEAQARCPIRGPVLSPPLRVDAFVRLKGHRRCLCGLTFELTRPERTDALPDGPTMTTGLSGKAAGRGGSRVERGVRRHFARGCAGLAR